MVIEKIMSAILMKNAKKRQEQAITTLKNPLSACRAWSISRRFNIYEYLFCHGYYECVGYVVYCCDRILFSVLGAEGENSLVKH